MVDIKTIHFVLFSDFENIMKSGSYFILRNGRNHIL